MNIWKGAYHCETCKKRVVMLGGTPVHVEADGTLRWVDGHRIVGGGR
ncbi:MAG: hypothetical protein NUW01_03510 [Gemmatimonadaceae bacterium]|nr:hypothetical protein [Gemmatimonadaceae bacterium]